MSILVIGGRRDFAITKENQADTVPRLERLLQKGSPVFVEEEETIPEMRLARPVAKRHLFFSDGHIHNRGGLGPQKGTRGFAYAILHGRDEDFGSYSVVAHSSKIENVAHIRLPWSSQQDRVNENTFSPRGPTREVVRHSGGTRRLLIGKCVEAQFPDALRDLRFAQDSYSFHLPAPYAHPTQAVYQSGVTEQQEESRAVDITRAVTIGAARHLINRSWAELHHYGFSILATQLSDYPESVTAYSKDGYPVSARDYVLHEDMAEQKLVGFLKATSVACANNVFLYPARGAEAAFEHALSEENISKYYPAGR